MNEGSWNGNRSFGSFDNDGFNRNINVDNNFYNRNVGGGTTTGLTVVTGAAGLGAMAGTTGHPTAGAGGEAHRWAGAWLHWPAPM